MRNVPSARTEQGVDDFPAVHDETEKHARIALGWLRRTWSDDVLRRALKEDDEVTAGHAFAAANAYGALSSLLGHFLRSRLSSQQGVDLDEIRSYLAMNYTSETAPWLTYATPHDAWTKWLPALIAEVESLRSRLSPGATDDRERALALWSEWVNEGWDRPDDDLKSTLGFTDEEKRRALDMTEDERDAVRYAARRPVSATPDAPHDACEHSRDCIACGKRIEPANGLCFSCATTDPKVRMEASRASVPAPGGGVPADLREKIARALARHHDPTREWETYSEPSRDEFLSEAGAALRALPVPMLTEEQKRDVALVTRHAREHVENMMDKIADEVEAACDRLDALASVSPHTEETPHGD